MTYKGPVLTTGPAQRRDERVMLAMLVTLRDTKGARDWLPGELGNRFGFRNYETALWHGFIERRSSTSDFVDLTPAGLALAAEEKP